MKRNKTELEKVLDVKRMLLNPIYLMEVYFEFPDSSLSYANTLYTTLYDLFYELFNGENTKDYIDKLVNKFKITDSKISQMHQRRFLPNLNKLLDITFDDIKDIQKEICLNNKGNEEVKNIILNYRRLLKNMEVDSEMLYIDLRSIDLFEDDDELKKISGHISNLINNVIFILTGGSNMSRKNKYSDKTVTEWKIDENGKTYFDILKKDKVKIDRSGEKKNKKELRHHVNEMDKDFGSNLKEPKEMLDDEYSYIIKVENLKLILARFIFILNKVDSSNYISTSSIFGTELRKIKINKSFKEESVLFDDAAHDLKSYNFKARFLTYLIRWVMVNLTTIADKCYKINDDSKFAEYDAKIEYVNYTVERLCDLITNMLTGKSFKDDLIYFTEIQIYLNTSKKDIKKNMDKIENLHNQSFILSKRFTWFTSADDDISMDTLLKLSYMTSTNDPKIKGKIDFNENYKFRNTKETYRMIEQLGEAIIDSRDKYGIPDLLKFFVKSEPKLWSRFKDVNENRELLIGMTALKYYAFVVNDKRIQKKVKHLTEW
jgi:hypothetical protein